MGMRLRRLALVTLMILAALVAPVALPIRIVVMHLRRDTAKTEFVIRHVTAGDTVLPETT